MEEAEAAKILTGMEKDNSDTAATQTTTEAATATETTATKKRGVTLPLRGAHRTNKFSRDCDKQAAKERETKKVTAERKASSNGSERKQAPSATRPTAKKRKTTDEALISEIKGLRSIVQTFQERAENKKAAIKETRAKRAEKKKRREEKKKAMGLPLVTRVNCLLTDPSHNFFKFSASAKDIHEWMTEEHKKDPLQEDLLEKIEALSRADNGKKAKAWREIAEDLFKERCPEQIRRTI